MTIFPPNSSFGLFIRSLNDLSIASRLYLSNIVASSIIINFDNLIRFSSMCGAEIPRWIRMRMECFRGDEQSIKQLGEEIVTSLCEELLAMGAPGLHFYTMNQAEPTIAIWDNLNL